MSASAQLSKKRHDLGSLQAAVPGLVTVLLEVLHERRASGSDGMRVLRVRLCLMEDVSRRVLEVQGAELLQAFSTSVVGRCE